MSKVKLITVLMAVVSLLLVAFVLPAVAVAVPSEQAAWGQATKAFTQESGGMGEHASSQTEPRLGLRNVARALFEQGLIEDDTMQALAAFLSAQ